MSLAALICAYHEAAEGEGLRATLPLAGRTVVERQARLAASAGAGAIVILVERVPAALAAAIERLRGEGVGAVVARSPADAVHAIAIDDRLLLMGDGVVADPAELMRLVKTNAATLLTIPDQGGDERYERIDADSRWAGVALVDGGLLHRTAEKLDDWDLQSTLLRRAVQSGARQIAARAGGETLPLTLADSAADLAAAEARIVAGAAGPRGDWTSRYLTAPIERSLAAALMPGAVTPDWLNLLAAAMTGLAIFLFASGYLSGGGALLLAAIPLDGIADRLAAVRMEPTALNRARASLPWLAGAALLALAYSLAEPAGWGTLALAATTLLFVVALRREAPAPALPGRVFLAGRKGMTVLMLPFALAGAWVAGLGVLAAYAAGSFFWAQRANHPPAARGREV